MKKLLCVLMVVLTASLLFAGCGGSGSASTASAAVDISTVEKALEAANPIDNPRAIDDFSIANDFGIDESLVEEYVGNISNDQGNSGLVLVIKAAEGKGGDVKAALDSYKASQETFFGNYPEFADGLAQVSDGRVLQSGDLVAIVFANTTGATYAAIDEAIKTSGAF